MKTIHELEQGGAAWHAFRAEHFGASESAAMLGISKYQTRPELLRRKATGIEPEVSPQLQAVFDRGHATEIGGRALAERIIGQELFPVTMSEGKLSASCDGLTMLEDIAFEHKQFNAALADSVRSGKLPEEHQPQCQQVMIVTGADQLLFMVSDGTEDNHAWMWVYPDKEWRKTLLQGWAQFAIDLEAYVHVEPTVAPVAAPIESLPALAVAVTGSISLVHNLDRFGKRLTEFVGGLNSKPETDQDFADLDAAVKVLKEAEAQLDAAEQNALAQTTTIADMQNLVAMYRKVARDNRLMYEKIVKQEKVNRKAAIINKARQALDEHIAKLNERIGGRWMPAFADARFAEAVAGLKSIDPMRDKVATALANAKIEANEIADRIEANRKSLTKDGQDWAFLFPDFAAVCTKAVDDFAGLYAIRISQHRAAEDARIAAAVEAERKAGEARAAAEAERIRKEEADKLAKQAAQPEPSPVVNQQLTTEAPSTVHQSDMGQSLNGLAGKTVRAADHLAGASKEIDAAMITEFIALQSCSPAAKKEMRAAIEKWEMYRCKVTAARGMTVAA